MFNVFDISVARHLVFAQKPGGVVRTCYPTLIRLPDSKDEFWVGRHEDSPTKPRHKLSITVWNLAVLQSLWTKRFLLTYAFSLLWRKSKHSRTWNNGTPIMIYTSKIKFGRTLMGKTCNLVVKPLAINFFFCTWRGLSCMKNVQRYAVCDLFAVTSILCNAHVQFPNRLQACPRVDWVHSLHCKTLEYTWTINLHSGFFGVLNGTSVCCLYMKFSFHRRIK